MTARERPIGEDDLHAYVDNRLSPERRAAVELYLSDRPALAETVARDADLANRLRARLAAKAEEPIPARLRIANIAADVAVRTPPLKALLAIAALLLFLLGGSGGWLLREAMVPGPAVGAGEAAVTRDALSAHRIFVVEKAHPVEVAADQQAHLVQWLSRRVGSSLATPDLAAEGYTLVGGRLLPAGQQAAAQFMYADADGNRLTLYARIGGRSLPSGFQFTRDSEVATLSWGERDLALVVAAAHADRPKLLQVAEAVERQFKL